MRVLKGSDRVPRQVAAGPGTSLETRQRRFPRDAGTGAARASGYGVTQPIEPTGRLLPVDVAVNPKVTLPSGGMVRL